ncbi:MAG: GNAT family N-acetyltransferase [Cytophagales bacterium]|nr:GNAT family N-acetyltransferase [Armatimonadota bacterium]
MVVAAASVRSTEAAALIAALTADLAARYNDEDGGAGDFAPSDVEQPGSLFLVAWLGEVAVGCAALRPLSSGIGEVKRMYVRPEARGRGLARRLLTEIERAAQHFGYTMLWLETGTEQPEAIALYQSAGYTPIPNYGYYLHHPRSRCFGKGLTP